MVIEDGASEETIGNAKAFIEVAWRKISKHASSKVKELSGAIVPLIKKLVDIFHFWSYISW